MVVPPQECGLLGFMLEETLVRSSKDDLGFKGGIERKNIVA